MIVRVTSAELAAAIPGRTDPLEIAGAREGVRLLTGARTIGVDHGLKHRTMWFPAPAWWPDRWAAFHHRGERGEGYMLEVPAGALEKLPPLEAPPTMRCRRCGKRGHLVSRCHQPEGGR